METESNYNYPIKNILVKDLSMIDNVNNYNQINLCVYIVNLSGKIPFLRYMLCKNNFDNFLSLPILPIFNLFEKYNLENYSKVFLSGILKFNDFENFNKNVVFDGYYEYNNELFLFFDLSLLNDDLYIDETYSSTDIRFALIDEIINHKHVCNIPVNNNTTDFFIKNNSINFLYDQNNESYEVPVVGYIGKSTPEKVNFVFTFGESAKNKSAILGPYFYFTDFYNAVRQANWSYSFNPEYMYERLITDNEYGRYIKGGIIRFALFTGNTKYIENMPHDKNDSSFIKQDRLNDSNINQKYEIQTLRISDHDGSWGSTYDSVILGNIELDDGSFIEDTPMLVLKDYNQQIPLTYHYIDKKKLGDKFSNNLNKNNYSIL